MKVKVLQYSGAMNRGGAETILMNIFRNIDREKFEFHFVTHSKETSDYDQEIIALGGKVIYLNKPNYKDLKTFKKEFKQMINDYGPYDAIHSHVQLFNGLILHEAKKNNIKRRISHAHLNGDYSKSSIIRNIYVHYSKYLIRKNSTEFIACSKDAGKYLYNNADFITMNNAIDVNLFNYDNKSKLLHEEYNLDFDNKIITHIGTFKSAKNHEYIIEVFNELIKRDNKWRLFLVGDGELKDKIVNKTRLYNLGDYVYFLGKREDIPHILQSTDVFIMPSILEGLPVVLVEAQAAGVPCIISNNIPTSCDLGLGLVKVLDLKDNLGYWCNEILKQNGNKIDFKTRKIAIKNSGYDLKKNIDLLENLYTK